MTETLCCQCMGPGFMVRELGASPTVLVVKDPPCQCRRCKRPRFNPWVRKIPWRKA